MKGELVDGGQHSTPSKRIGAVFPEYRYSHASIGPRIAGLIGLGAIRAKCPHFDAWITRLEKPTPPVPPAAPPPDMALHPTGEGV